MIIRIVIALMLFCYQGIGQDSVIVCEEKYLPFQISLGFLTDSINYNHLKIEENSFIVHKKGCSQWFAKYTKVYTNGTWYYNTEFNNTYGKLTCHAYTDTCNLSLFFNRKEYDVNYSVKNCRLNYNVFGYHRSTGKIRLGINAAERGFKDNARVGEFIYKYDNERMFAKGSYSGDYLKIDTSKNGKELIFYNNYGIELKRVKNTHAAIDSLKAKYGIYKFDFSFPILVEFRDGWWEFGNYDGTPDRKILYKKGHEIDTIIY